MKYVLALLVLVGALVWFNTQKQEAIAPQVEDVPATTEEPVVKEPETTHEGQDAGLDDMPPGNDAGMEYPKPDSEDEDTVACTMDAKACPDGSYVGRVGPSCEFAPCPSGTGGEIDSSAKVFNVTGKNFSFSMNEIRVKKGDTVTIKFKSADGFHDWVIDEFDAKTSRVQTGGESQVTFVADKKGTYEYYCSVGSHRANGMVGKLIVE